MKQKRKQKHQVIAITGVTLAILGAIILYNNYKNEQMEKYAEQNHCKWVISGAHDICK